MSKEFITKHKYYNNKWFAKWARVYDLEKYLLVPIRKKAAKFLPLTLPGKVIDIATGTGSQAYELAKLGYEVVGIDLSPEMLLQAKKKLKPSLKLSFRQADAADLPFRDDFFDVASISFGLHDMPHEIDLLVLREIKRITKRGGWILIIDYMEPNKHWVAKFSHHFVKLYETQNYIPFIKIGLEKILKRVRLKISKRTSFLGVIQIVLVKNVK